MILFGQQKTGNEALFRMLMELSGSLVCVTDAQGLIRAASRSFESELGYAMASLEGRLLSDFLPVKNRADYQRHHAWLLNNPGKTPSESLLSEMRHIDGSSRFYSVQYRNCLTDPDIQGIVYFGQDITTHIHSRRQERERSKRQLEYRQILLDLATTTRPVFAKALDRLLTVVAETLQVDVAGYWRFNGENLLECEAEYRADLPTGSGHGGMARNQVGRMLKLNMVEEYRARIFANEPVIVPDVYTHLAVNNQQVHSCFEHGVGAFLDIPVWFNGETIAILNLQTHYRSRIWEAEEFNFAANISTLLSLSLEQEQRIHAQAKHEELALFDPLTHLPNRRHFERRFAEVLKQAEAENKKFCLMMIDLDHFKEINDTYGHHAGDEVLKSAADFLCKVVPAGHMIARMGGDEFVVLTSPDDNAEQMADIAAQIVDGLMQQQPVVYMRQSILASVGVAIYPEHGTDLTTLLKNSDAAMYQAKQDGRSASRVFDAERVYAIRNYLQLENDLRRAVENNELVLHYQPQIDLETGLVIGAEALLRWQHPQRGLLSPNEFIVFAEKRGLLEDITGWVLREACRQAKQWETEGVRDCAVSINASARQFYDRTFYDLVNQALQAVGLSPTKLIIELTEHTLMEQNADSENTMHRLAQLGVGLAIDDFGVGYSSLAYLKRLPVDTIKIDRTFVTDLEQDPDSQAIVRAMVSMAHHLQLLVVAEGIETSAQMELLKAMHCNIAQGYLYSRPLPAEQALGFMLARQGLLMDSILAH